MRCILRKRARKHDSLTAFLVIRQCSQGLERFGGVNAYSLALKMIISFTVGVGLHRILINVTTYFPSHPPIAQTRASARMEIHALPGCFVL